jgi:hypothetical protein
MEFHLLISTQSNHDMPCPRVVRAGGAADAHGSARRRGLARRAAEAAGSARRRGVRARYREHHDIKSTELAEVLAQMCQNGWAFCKQIQKQGILETYDKEFTAQCEGKSFFTKEIISCMFRPVRKRARLAFTAEACEAVEASSSEQAESPSGLETAAATAAKAASAVLAARATLAVRAAWGPKKNSGPAGLG